MSAFLASVRNLSEAVMAHRAGADWIDPKGAGRRRAGRSGPKYGRGSGAVASAPGKEGVD